jgi:predicted acetylornithine/succinylornithine family transaminase
MATKKRNKAIIALTDRYVAQTYNRVPIALVRGKGMHVWDADGKRYVDFVAGLAVDNLGHCPPAVVQALRKQAGILLHVCNIYHIKPQSELARELVHNSFADRVFFCNSGAEANESAIKLARKFYFDAGHMDKYEIITMENSFHGRTFGGLSATAQKKFHKGFEPLLQGFKYVPFNDIEAVRQAITQKTCAVMLEPIQGEGGVNVADKAYLKELQQLCKQENLLLIFDEVQTGFGRTGALFAYNQYGVTPDIITLAKALGGGVAIGAMAATQRVMQAFVPGTHAATFGGNPLACAAALASLKIVARKGFLQSVSRVGRHFKSRLLELQKKFPFIKSVRGLGLMLAMELDRPAAPLVQDCMERGFLINCVQQNTARFVPPLIVSRKEIDALIKVLDQSLKKLSGQKPHKLIITRSR